MCTVKKAMIMKMTHSIIDQTDQPAFIQPLQNNDIEYLAKGMIHILLARLFEF